MVEGCVNYNFGQQSILIMFLTFFSPSQDGQWTILEPIMYVEIVAPDENQGAVMTMMSRRDGVILGTDGSDGWVTLTVEAPLNKVHIHGSGFPDFSGFQWING